MKSWPEASAPVSTYDGQRAFPPSSVAFPNNTGASTITTGAVGDGNAPTLARHPKMKKFVGNAPKDIFSFENAAAPTNVSNNHNPNPLAVPSRETSLDFNLFSSLARETSLLSWMPRQETEKTLP